MKLTKEQQKAMDSCPIGRWFSAKEVGLRPVVMRNLAKKGVLKMEPVHVITSKEGIDGFKYWRKG